MNLNEYFEAKKTEILNKLNIDIDFFENYIRYFSNPELMQYPTVMMKYELKLTQLRELHKKIKNIKEDKKDGI